MFRFLTAVHFKPNNIYLLFKVSLSTSTPFIIDHNSLDVTPYHKERTTSTTNSNSRICKCFFKSLPGHQRHQLSFDSFCLLFVWLLLFALLPLSQFYAKIRNSSLCSIDFGGAGSSHSPNSAS